MTAKRRRKWSDRARREALAVIDECSGDVRGAHRVLMHRAKQPSRVPSYSTLALWNRKRRAEEARKEIGSPEPREPTSSAGASAPVSSRELLKEAAACLRRVRDEALAPRDRANVATALASVAGRLAALEEGGSVGVEVMGINLSDDEGRAFLTWIREHREATSLSDADLWRRIESNVAGMGYRLVPEHLAPDHDGGLSPESSAPLFRLPAAIGDDEDGAERPALSNATYRSHSPDRPASPGASHG